MRSAILRVGVMVLLLLATACPRLVPAPASDEAGAPGAPVAQSTVPPIVGTVGFGPAPLGVLASMGEVGSGATVSLIDTRSSFTLATTLTTAAGEFVMNFADSWTPDPDAIYVLEAIKGLKAGTAFPNRVGAVAARVRTLVTFRGGTWQSMSAGMLTINPTTTALAICLSLRSLTPPAAGRQIPPASLIGIVQPTSGTSSTPSPYSYSDQALLPGAMVLGAYLQTLSALAVDRDPVTAITLAAGDPLYNTLANASSNLTVAAVQPDTMTIGGTVVVVGSGFSTSPADETVSFSTSGGGLTLAQIATVSADGTRITVTVPPGAVTGPVSVTLKTASQVMIGPTFYLTLKTGHQAEDQAGNVYVANEGFGTIVKISQQGAISAWASGLTSPRNIAIVGDKMYVTCAGAQANVVVIPLASPGSVTNYCPTGAIADPRGIAFDATGRCWVSDGASNKLWHIDGQSAAPVQFTTSGALLNRPMGMAFGQDGNLYVANYGANTVLQVNVATGAATSFLQGLSSPWAVTFDSIGNLYVTNNKGNSISRYRASSGTLSAFASVPSPGGMVSNAAGYIFAIDNNANNIYRISPDGDSSIFASGISAPTGVVKVGNILYVLSSTYNTLVAVNLSTSALTILTRGFNSPYGMAYDPDRDVFYVTNRGNSTLTTVVRATGTATTALQAVVPGGIMYSNGRLYMRAGMYVVAYDVTDFGAPPLKYHSNMLWNTGVAKDTSGSANGGSFYIGSNPDVDGISRVLRVVGDGAGMGSAGAGNYVTVFKDSIADTNLRSPRDVAVDGTGNVWVVNNLGASPGKLTIYTPAGTPTAFSPITTGSNPLGINRDATTIWVANHDSQTIVGYVPATGAIQRTISIAGHPRNLVVQGANMYLACDEGVGMISNYATAPVYSIIYGGLTYYSDIEIDDSGEIYVLNGSGR